MFDEETAVYTTFLYPKSERSRPKSSYVLIEGRVGLPYDSNVRHFKIFDPLGTQSPIIDATCILRDVRAYADNNRLFAWIFTRVPRRSYRDLDF